MIIAICAKRLKDENMLKNDTVVTTVMSNLGLSIALKEMGIKNVVAKVGDRYVLEEMIKHDCIPVSYTHLIREKALILKKLLIFVNG